MARNFIVYLNILGLFGLTLVLGAAFVLQFALRELPCPLCLLQRVGISMVMFGFMLNVVYAPRQRHLGIALFGALFGAATSLRQISLHVLPGSPGYGSMLFGYHYYTWAFILFVLVIFGIAMLLMLWDLDWHKEDYSMPKIGLWVCRLAVLIIGINVLASFAECGPFECPDNPMMYWLHF